MQRRFPTLVLGTVFMFIFGTTACGGDDDGATDVTDPPAAETLGESTAADDPVQTAGDDGDDDGDGEAQPDAPAPDENSGTVTVAGTTTEVGTADFLICETVNPAFANDFNIITALSDGTKVRVNGTLDEMDPEFDGLFLGEIPEEEHATDLDISRDGRTISGSATVTAGDVEFSFTC
jgi:hypothetical protein